MMSLRKRALFLAGLFVAVSCSDAGNPLDPGTPGPKPAPEDVLQALNCSVNVQAGSMACAPAQPGTGDAQGLIVGGQGLYVFLAAANFSTAADTVAFDVTVKNLIPQPLGTTDGTTLDADGVRVFFTEGPTGFPTGTADVGNEDGEATFIAGTDPYFQYNEVLSPDETSPARRWKLTYAGGATNIRFKVYVAAKVQHENGWVTVTPALDTITPTDSVALSAVVRTRTGQITNEPVTWNSSNTAVATVSSTGRVHGVAAGTATITASTGTRTPGTATIVVNTSPAFVVDSIGALSNVTVAEPAPGLLQGASDGDGHAVSVVPDTVTTDRNGTAWLNADGSYEYLSRSGFSGRDTIRFELTDGVSRRAAYAVVDVEPSNYWYVRAGGTGDGRDRFPFGTLAAAQDSAAAGDSIFVLANGAQQVDGAVTLESGQAVIGQGIPSAITRTVNGQTVTVLATGSAPELTNTGAGATITLGTGNVIRGVGITAGAGAGIAGTNFGTLFVRNVGVNPAGPALLLNTGALDAVFDVLSSTSSGTTGVSLTGVTGTLTGTGGAISGSTGTAFHVSGGSADISYGGSISNASGSAVSISGRTGGALTLSGTITDTGSGITVTGNTGGTIGFTGSSKSISTANNAGVTVTNNTGATVTFGGGDLDITTTSGAGFTASGGGTVSVSGAGNSIASTTGTALTLDGVSTGASGVSFVSVSANGAASGIVLSSVTGAGVQVTGSGTTAGSGGTIQNTTSHGVSLGAMGGADSVHLQYMNVGGGAGGSAGIFGGNFGTLRVTGVSVGTTGGPALSLATGTLNGTFSSLGSAGSASNGVILTSTDGAFTAQAGTISNAAGSGFAVAGGSVAATYQGGISQGANNAALVAVSGSHSGSLTFNTGTLSATTGTGLSFNDAQGTYAFAGTTTLNGGDAGIDITNGSAGTFTFGTGTSVTSPTGSAFTVYGASPTVTYSGNLAKGNAGRLVEIGEQPGGSVTFQTGTLLATAGTGISFSNADGTNAFTGTTTLNGGDAGIDVVSGSEGALSFGSGASIGNASGIALHVLNGGANTNLTYAGSIASTATGLAVHVEGVSGGTVTASGSISGSMGILVQNNTGGTITFSGTKSLSTGANTAVSLVSNTGATIGFTNGNTDLTTTTGTAFAASGGGTINVSGAGSDISTGTGAALTLNGVTLGASGMAFATLNTGAALAPVSLTNVGVTTGSVLTVSGGSIPAANGTRFAVSGGSVNVNWAGSISQSTHSAPLVSVTGVVGHTGTLTFSGALSATSGNGLQFDNADGTYNFTGTTTLNGGDAGIDVLNGSGGTFSFPASVGITNPSGPALFVDASAPANLTYAGSISTASGFGRPVHIEDLTGGTITVSGSITTTGQGMLVQNNVAGSPSITFSGSTKSFTTTTNAAVTLFNNDNATLTFSGGNLAISTTSGAGFAATAGAAGVNVTGANNTISSGTGTALNVQDSNIGSSGLSFRSVSHSGGSNGIFLSNTGSANGLQVTGDGSTPGSGGTIVNTTGTDGTTAGRGVHLSGVSNVSLNWMGMSGHANYAVHGTTVSGFTMNRTRITGTNGTSVSGDGEGGVYFYGLTGSASITSSLIEGGAARNVNVVNTSGTLDRLTMTNDTIGHDGTSGSDGIFLQADNSANTGNALTFKATVQNSRFLGSRGDQIQMSARGTSVSDFVFTGNTLTNNHPNRLPSNFGVAVSGGGDLATFNPTLTYTISNNTIRDAGSTAISVGKGGNGAGTFTGTISGNAIGVAGVANSGAEQGSAIVVDIVGGGSHNSTITNNTIRQFTNYGVLAQSGNNSAAAGGQGYLTVTIKGNDIAEPSPNSVAALFPTSGIRVMQGTNTGDNSKNCVVLGGTLASEKNTVTGTGTNGGLDLRLFQRFVTLLGVPGYAGANNDNAAMNTFLTARNTLSTVSATNNTAAGGPGYSGSCPA